MNLPRSYRILTPCALAAMTALLVADITVPQGASYGNANKNGSGGAIFEYQTAEFAGTAAFSNNTVRGTSDGGAIHAYHIRQQQAASHTGNKSVNGNGGAVYSRGNASLGQNSSYAENWAKHHGGAICFDVNDETTRTISIESGSQFIDNLSGLEGGAIYVAGLSGKYPTVMTLNSRTPDRPILFSGNQARVSFNDSFTPRQDSGNPNAITIMGHVSIIMNAEASCEIIFDDPLFSLQGYSSSSSIEKKGAGTLTLRNHLSSCRFPVRLKEGTIAFEHGGGIIDAESFTVDANTTVSIAIGSAIPGIDAKQISFADTATLNLILPGEVPDTETVWPLLSSADMNIPETLSPRYSSDNSDWGEKGTLSLSKNLVGGVTVLNLVWTPNPAPGPYDQWTGGSFPPETPPENMKKGANPSGDGINNLTKYALGLDPLKKYGTQGKALIVTEDGEQYLRVEYPYNPDATDILFTGQRLERTDESLYIWTNDEVTTEIKDGKIIIQSAIPVRMAPRQFLRLHIKTSEDTSTQPV